MTTNDDPRPDDGVEGSWSPKRGKGRKTPTRTSESGKDSGSSPDPEVLADEIEKTREELAETLDAIAEKVSPKKAVERKKKAAKDGAADAVDAVKETVSGAAESVKSGVAAVKEKVTGDSETARGPLIPAGAGAAAPLSDDTVSMPGASVPLEPAPTPGSLADAAYTVTEPAGAETPLSAGSLPPAPPSRLPVLAGAGAAVLVLLYVMKRRRR